MRERRAAEASERLSTGPDLETLSDGRTVPNPTPGWHSPYAPRPADPLPEPADPRAESPATRGRVQHDLSSVSNEIRRDAVRLRHTLAAQQLSQRAPDGRSRSEIAGGQGSLAEMRARYGMDEDEQPHVHDYVFESPVGRRHRAPMPDSEMADNVFYGRGLR